MTLEEMIEKTDAAIADLVHPRPKLLKAYNYYNGIRDPELFLYLEENFGLKNPTSVEFTPLVKKHIDALIGEFLGTPIIPTVTCKDSETISNINRDKQLKIYSEVSNFLKSKLSNSILEFIDKKLNTDVNIQLQLDKLIEDIEDNFISEYEIAALNVILYLIQSRLADFYTKLRFALLDLLIAGYCLFRGHPSPNLNNVSIEVLDPRNTFVDRNPESVYIKDSYRVVIRRWMSKQQVLNKYGKLLKKEDLDTIKNNWENEFADYGSYYVEAKVGERFAPASEDLDNGIAIESGYPFDEPLYNNLLVPVYEVEWIETDKDFRLDRYSTIRIAEDIYILNGKDENAIRTKDNPSHCGLSVNGIFFTNRSNKPYSLMLACASIQDRYDLLNYIKDNLLASAGSIGDYLDVSMLPSFLGTSIPERLLKYIAYKKQGIALIDSAQEGRLATGQAAINTLFNGFDDTIKAPTILAIQIAIDSLEQTLSSITGVYRERLNGIELRDAVTNIKQGVLNSFIITKQYYQLMDLAIDELLLDCLNVAKRVYKNGLTGALILGDKLQKIFTALSEHFTVTDYDIHVLTSTTVLKDLETIKLLIPDLIKGLMISPDIIFEALTAKSLTELKQKAVLSMKKLKLENDLLGLLLLLVEQLSQELKQSNSQLQQALRKIETLNEQKLQIESQKMQSDAKIAWYQAQTDRTYKTLEAEIDKRKVEIEYLQLSDGNPYNDKVNFDK